MTDQPPHAPSYEEVREATESDVIFLEEGELDRFLAARDARIESAAEQRGAVRHLREVASELNMHHLTEDLSDSALKLGVRFVNLIQDRADRVEGTTSDDND